MEAGYSGVRHSLCSDDLDGAAALYPEGGGTPTPTPTPTPFLRGDVNCNDIVDAIDALFVLRFVVALLPLADCIAAGDVNCNGVADAADALLLQRFVVGLGPPSPLPAPPGTPTPTGTPTLTSMPTPTPVPTSTPTNPYRRLPRDRLTGAEAGLTGCPLIGPAGP